LSPTGQPSAENMIPTEFLPEGFTLANMAEAGLVLAMEHREDPKDDFTVIELASQRKVNSQEGVRRYGLPIGTPLGTGAGAVGAKQPRNKAKPADGTYAKSSDPRVSQGEDLKAGKNKSDKGGAAVQRILTHPKLKNAKILVYADGTVQIQFPDGSKTAKLQFDWKKFTEKGWTASITKEKD